MRQRQAAAIELADRLSDIEATAALDEVAWSDRQPAPLRITVLNRLAERDLPGYAATVRQRIGEVDQWPVLEHLLEQACRERWQGAEVVVVVSWARPSQRFGDAVRPERAALARLVPGQPVERTVYEIFSRRRAGATLAERVRAWELLHRILPESELRAALDTEGDSDILVRALRDASVALGELPATREQVLWLLALDKLPPPTADDDRPALRHLATQLGDGRSRDDLLDAIRRRLADAHHVQRQRGGVTFLPVDESLDAHADHLHRRDLVLVDHLLSVLRQRAVVRSLFEQADADHADRTAEHGGVLVGQGSSVEATAFEPAVRLHDHIYVPPVALVSALQRGIAHYHFHAQDYDNALNAGPGGGDLAFADRFGAACVVLTFVNRDTLNVDYYQPGHVVLDLGTITRP